MIIIIWSQVDNANSHCNSHISGIISNIVGMNKMRKPKYNKGDMRILNAYSLTVIQRLCHNNARYDFIPIFFSLLLVPFAPQQRRLSLYALQPDRQRTKRAKHCLLTHFPLIWHYIQVKIGTAVSYRQAV